MACEKIMKRLKPIKKANPISTWKEIVQKAYFESIGLSATGFYR